MSKEYFQPKSAEKTRIFSLAIRNVVELLLTPFWIKIAQKEKKHLLKQKYYRSIDEGPGGGGAWVAILGLKSGLLLFG